MSTLLFDHYEGVLLIELYPERVFVAGFASTAPVTSQSMFASVRCPSVLLSLL